MNYKYRVDEDYKLIYVTEFAKMDKNTITFEEIIVNINQNPVSNSAILTTNIEKLKESSAPMKMLQEAKCEQMQIRVKGFTMHTRAFYERDVNRYNSKSDTSKKRSESGNEEFGRMTMSNIGTGRTSSGFENYFDENNNEFVIQDTRAYYNKVSKGKFIFE